MSMAERETKGEKQKIKQDERRGEVPPASELTHTGTAADVSDHRSKS